MPWITINLRKGRNREEKEKLHKEVTETVCRSLNIPKDWVTIQIVEMDPEDGSIGGIPLDKLP